MFKGKITYVDQGRENNNPATKARLMYLCKLCRQKGLVWRLLRLILFREMFMGFAFYTDILVRKSIKQYWIPPSRDGSSPPKQATDYTASREFK